MEWGPEEEEEALGEEDEEGHDVVVLKVEDLEESGPGEDPEGEGLEERHLEGAGPVEGGRGHEEETELSYCVEAAARNRF